MSRRRPRVVGSEYEISLAEMPPPGPPEYELVNAWTPSTPRATKPSRLDRVPTFMATIALAIAIASLLANMQVLHVPSLIAPTALVYKSTAIETSIQYITIATTTTVTQTSTTTTMKQISVGNIEFCRIGNIEIRMENFTFGIINATHRRFTSFINVRAPGAARLPNVSKNNFAVKYELDDRPTDAECRIDRIPISGVAMGIRLNCTMPYPERPYKVYIYFNDGECIIAAFYG